MWNRIRKYVDQSARYHDPGAGALMATLGVAFVFGLLLLF